MSVWGPLGEFNPTVTHMSYGNSLQNNYIYFFPRKKQIYFSSLDANESTTTNATTSINIYKSPYNEFFEPATNSTTLYSNNFKHETRLFLASMKSFPYYWWTEVGNHFISNCTTIGIVAKLDLNSTDRMNGQQVDEGIAVFCDIQFMNQILNKIALDNTDMQTKSITIALVDRNGIVLSTSVANLTSCIFERRPLSTLGDHYKSVSEILTKQGMIFSNLTQPPSTVANKKKTVAYIGGVRVSAELFGDYQHGLDLIVVVSTTEYGVVKIVLTSSPILLSASIILIVLGTLLMFIFLQLTTRAILKVATNMFNISNMQINKVNYSKLLNAIFELKLLQNSCRAVQRVHLGFSKYIPNKEIIREIILGSSPLFPAPTTTPEETTTLFNMKHMQTTIMFTDIADFTNLSESISISSLIELLSHYFTVVTMCVERNGGIIDKFIGDGTMSIFSHPLRILDQHAVLGCKSALDCLMEMEKLNENSSLKPRMNIRIGINSGLASIGNIGSIDRLNYTAIGDVVNIASSLESLCKKYGVQALIGESTYEEVREEYLCFFVDTVKSKDMYLIETEWKNSNALQKEVHNDLVQVRNYLHSHQYQLLIDKVNYVKEYCASSNPLLTIMETIMEETEIRNDDDKLLVRSNMKFLELLTEKATVLMKTEIEIDSNVNE